MQIVQRVYHVMTLLTLVCSCNYLFINPVNWVRQTYIPQLLRLGVSEIINQPNLLETLEPLYDSYKVQIRVNSCLHR